MNNLKNQKRRMKSLSLPPNLHRLGIIKNLIQTQLNFKPCQILQTKLSKKRKKIMASSFMIEINWKFKVLNL
jgi:hypothetical protein